MSALSGRPLGVTAPLMGVVAERLPLRPGGRPLIYVARSPDDVASLPYRLLGRRRFLAILAGEGLEQALDNGIPAVVDLPLADLAALGAGDVVFIEPTGRVVVVYKAGSPHNCLFVTNRCNCLCLMCPQPPGDDPEGLLEQNFQLINLLDPREVSCLAITGGEPTLLGERLVELIRLCRRRLPKTHLTLLTNARKLKNLDYARELVLAGYPAFLVEVPLFAATDTEHDHIMGARGSFWDTLQALHHLARLEQPVGLRTVLHALTAPRLRQYAEFVYRNFPFVAQVAFMGMETTGLAAKNLDCLWLDPYEYREELEAAVRHLARRMIPVSVYNHPLCLLTPATRPFARKSITTWKQSYPPVCDSCGQRESCGGVFGTGVRQSTHLHPLP
ncbi:MAG: His-Xaa-Ser system radical SAM maturase HxsC [Desulfobaccales bacterium]